MQGGTPFRAPIVTSIPSRAAVAGCRRMARTDLMPSCLHSAYRFTQVCSRPWVLLHLLFSCRHTNTVCDIARYSVSTAAPQEPTFVHPLRHTLLVADGAGVEGVHCSIPIQVPTPAHGDRVVGGEVEGVRHDKEEGGRRREEGIHVRASTIH
jgi:hypothetical protein